MSVYTELLAVIEADIAEACEQAGIVDTIWSDDGESSYHIKHTNGRFTCTCPGYQNRRSCRHVTQYIEKLGGPLYNQCGFCHQPKELNTSKFCCERCKHLSYYAETKNGDAVVKAMAAR